MRKYFNKIALVAVMATLMSGCYRERQCSLEHYTNKNPRAAHFFKSDTLNMAQLSEKYMDMVDGDTLVVRGLLASNEGSGYRGHVFDFPKYIHDSIDFESYNYQVQFLYDRKLWLMPTDGMDSLADDTPLMVKGILHLGFWGPGTDSYWKMAKFNGHVCVEFSYFDVLEFTIEDKEE